MPIYGHVQSDSPRESRTDLRSSSPAPRPLSDQTSSSSLRHSLSQPSLRHPRWHDHPTHEDTALSDRTLVDPPAPLSAAATSTSFGARSSTSLSSLRSRTTGSHVEGASHDVVDLTRHPAFHSHPRGPKGSQDATLAHIPSSSSISSLEKEKWREKDAYLEKGNEKEIGEIEHRETRVGKHPRTDDLYIKNDRNGRKIGIPWGKYPRIRAGPDCVACVCNGCIVSRLRDQIQDHLDRTICMYKLHLSSMSKRNIY